ncbi:MAG: hypothetical protein V4722_10780 [Bacteroidota bacterium]
MKKWLLTALAACICVMILQAQTDSPVPHFEGIVKAMRAVNEKYLVYNSAAAHSSVKKAERKRQDLLAQIDKSRYAIAELGYYKNDRVLAKATTDYFKLLTDNMNDNYAKIVNLEEIAEQSYDNMEAYLLLRKKVAERMEAAGDTMQSRQEEYCKRHGITLSSSEDEMSQKMKKAGEVSEYNDNLYLIFFKCSAQEEDMMEALEKKNITAMEQIKGAMVKYADEGLARLDTTKSFSGDASLKAACKRTLDFFKKEADKMSISTDFIMKQEAFDKIKKTFESSPTARSNKQEIDNYNKAVSELNKALNISNQNNNYLNETRAGVYKDWNEATATFLDTHMPYAK